MSDFEDIILESLAKLVQDLRIMKKLKENKMEARLKSCWQVTCLNGITTTKYITGDFSIPEDARRMLPDEEIITPEGFRDIYYHRPDCALFTKREPIEL